MRNVSVSYGKKQVMKNIDLSIATGKLYAIVGPNGAGKTTLINAAARQVRVNNGEIIIDGRNTKDISRRDFAKISALLPQYRDIPDVTVSDMISMGRFPHRGIGTGLSEDDIKIIKRSMMLAGVEKFADKPVRRLSGGERQRVYLAMLMAQDTKYLFLDEPTTYLDIAGCIEMMQILSRMRNDGKCIAAVLHDLVLAMSFADELIVIDGGEAVFVGTPEEAFAAKIGEKIFGVELKRIHEDNRIVYYYDSHI